MLLHAVKRVNCTLTTIFFNFYLLTNEYPFLPISYGFAEIISTRMQQASLYVWRDNENNLPESDFL